MSTLGEEKKAFLRYNRGVYGYPAALSDGFDSWRAKEFPQLEGTTYVDHAGSTIYSEGQMRDVMKALSENLYGNPHSLHASGAASSAVVAQLRQALLALCGTSSHEYAAVLTSGATSALRTVAELFPWGPGSCLCYTRDNHTSVVGMRQYALAAGASAMVLDVGVSRHASGRRTRPAPMTAATTAGGHDCGQAHGSCALEPTAHACREAPACAPALVERLDVGGHKMWDGEGGKRWAFRGTWVTLMERGGGGAMPSCAASCPGGGDGGHNRGWAGGGDDGGGQALLLPTREASAHGGCAWRMCNGQQNHHHHEHPAGHGPCRVGVLPLPSLLVFPTESNFTGQRYGLGMMAAFRAWRRQQAHQGAHGGADGISLAHADAQGPWQDPCTACVPEGRWFVMLDAAKGFASRPPDLSKYKADFVALSLYKMCGYPSGLGALLIRRETASDILRAQGYFGGGTVAACVADQDYVMRRAALEERLENGTVPFLEAIAALQGLAALQRLGGMPPIHRHVTCLARYLAWELQALRHGNGLPVCQLYGWEDLAGRAWPQQGDDDLASGEGEESEAEVEEEDLDECIHSGSIVCFNLLRESGGFVGSAEVEQMAGLMGIQLRIGCLCNPGACAQYLGLTSEDVRRNYEAGHVCWDRIDLLNAKPTGAVRVSFGYMSSFEDAQAVMDFVRKYFVEDSRKVEAAVAMAAASDAAPSVGAGSGTKAAPLVERDVAARSPAPSLLPPMREVEEHPAQPPRATVSKLFVYPIKSCQGFSPASWPITRYGLKYDRQWAIVGEDYSVMTLTKHPAMCRLKASVDLDTRMLWVESPDMPNILMLPPAHEPEAPAAAASIPEEAAEHSPAPGSGVGVSVCGDKVCSVPHAWDSPASAWLSQALGVKCTLVAYPPNALRAGTMRVWVGGAKGEADGSGATTPAGGGPGHLDRVAEDGSMQSFANEGQFLLVSSASVRELNHHIRARHAEGQLLRAMLLVQEGGAAVASHPLRRHSLCVPVSSRHEDMLLDVAEETFRPNIVVEGDQLQPFEEDSWRAVTFQGRGDEGLLTTSDFEVLGGCRRCAMICLDTQTGKFRKDQEPLKTLATFRRAQGRILFGVHMALAATGSGAVFHQDGNEGEAVLHVGDHLGVMNKAREPES